MSFDSAAYLMFLPAAVLLNRLCPRPWRWAVLLAASLFFYASWSIPLTGLLLAEAGIVWLAGLAMGRWKSPTLRRLTLGLALAFCFGLLGYFKYFNFLAEAVAALWGGTWSAWDIILPVGCSFYTFQAASYAVDVYRGRLEPERHPGFLTLYIAFFPQLVAGPIERAGDLLPQLRAARTPDRADVEAGGRLLLSGFFRKVVIADFCGGFVTAVYSAQNPDGSAVFAATLLFSLQICCDFAGYSEIAAGSARLLGLRLMRNFDRPYLSSSFRQFWRRWHISLGRWFTDYVYIPLGGSRRGVGRQLFAVFVVFALSGLWHGAEWSFVVWGLFHGVLFAAELLLRRAGAGPVRTKAGRALSTCVVFALTSFGWIFFRADSLSHAGMLLGQLFSSWDVPAGLAGLGLTLRYGPRLGLALALLPGLERLGWGGEGERPSHMTCVYVFLTIAVAWLLRLSSGGAGTFIYFQF